MTHNETGLKYLCKTTQNLLTYFGSGKHWKKHLELHGKNVSKEILKICDTMEEFSFWGRHYSKLFNVVGAMDDYGNKIWANIIPETGGGPGWGHGDKNILKNPTIKEKMINAINTPSCKELRSKNNGMKKSEVVSKVFATHALPDNKKKFSNKMIEINAREEVKQKKREWTLNNNPMHDPVIRSAWELKMKDPTIWEKRKEKYIPKKHGRYDHTVYEFIHFDGTIEHCQRYELQQKYNLSGSKLCELVNGTRKTHKGWRLSKVL